MTNDNSNWEKRFFQGRGDCVAEAAEMKTPSATSATSALPGPVPATIASSQSTPVVQSQATDATPSATSATSALPGQVLTTDASSTATVTSASQSKGVVKTTSVTSNQSQSKSIKSSNPQARFYSAPCSKSCCKDNTQSQSNSIRSSNPQPRTQSVPCSTEMSAKEIGYLKEIVDATVTIFMTAYENTVRYDNFKESILRMKRLELTDDKMGKLLTIMPELTSLHVGKNILLKLQTDLASPSTKKQLLREVHQRIDQSNGTIIAQQFQFPKKMDLFQVFAERKKTLNLQTLEERGLQEINLDEIKTKPIKNFDPEMHKRIVVRSRAKSVGRACEEFKEKKRQQQVVESLRKHLDAKFLVERKPAIHLKNFIFSHSEKDLDEFRVKLTTYLPQLTEYSIVMGLDGEEYICNRQFSLHNRRMNQLRLETCLEKDRLINQIEDLPYLKWLEVRNFDKMGRGVITTVKIPKNKLVLEYKGDLITKREGLEREKTYCQTQNEHNFLFFFSHNGNNWCLDATKENDDHTDMGRLVNHSVLEANLKPQVLEDKDKKVRLVFISSKVIEANEQLLYDYGETRKDVLKANPWLSKTSLKPTDQSSGCEISSTVETVELSTPNLESRKTLDQISASHKSLESKQQLLKTSIEHLVEFTADLDSLITAKNNETIDTCKLLIKEVGLDEVLYENFVLII